MRPRRILLQRRKGFDLQAFSQALNGLPAQSVARPGPWGNPFAIEDVMGATGLDRAAAQAEAVSRCGRWLRGEKGLSPKTPPSVESIRSELAGRNLACWCRAGDPCHADILIEIANGGGDEE